MSYGHEPSTYFIASITKAQHGIDTNNYNSSDDADLQLRLGILLERERLEAYGYGDHVIEINLGTYMLSVDNKRPQAIEINILFDYTNEDVMQKLV